MSHVRPKPTKVRTLDAFLKPSRSQDQRASPPSKRHAGPRADATPIPQSSYKPPPGKGYEMWDDKHVKLPCSSKNLYFSRDGKSVSKWGMIVKQMERKLASGQDLEDAILSINPTYRGKWDFSGLEEFFASHCERSLARTFFEVTVPWMQKMVRATPDLFPGPLGLLNINSNSSLVLNQQQVACLLANAFFCTFPHRNQSRWSKKPTEYGNFPSINFTALFQAQAPSTTNAACSQSQAAKLHCFLNYMYVQGKYQSQHKIAFIRHSLSHVPNWAKSPTMLCDLRCHVEGNIEDSNPTYVQVDFANKFMGGGVIGKGCVQEEVLFCIFPELIISRLFCECLQDNESIVMRGAQRYADYEGYSDTFTYKGPHKDVAPMVSDSWRERTMVAIDAQNYADRDLDPSDQFQPYYIERELNKAYCGFVNGLQATDPKADPPQPWSSRRASEAKVLATGNWGCGAFKGDRELKAMIQIIAASQAGYKRIEYFTFKDKDLADRLTMVHKSLQDNKITVGAIYHWLLDIDMAQKMSSKPEAVLDILFGHVQGT